MEHDPCKLLYSYLQRYLLPNFQIGAYQNYAHVGCGI